MAKGLGVLVAELVAWALTATAAFAEGRWQALENNPGCVQMSASGYKQTFWEVRQRVLWVPKIHAALRR